MNGSELLDIDRESFGSYLQWNSYLSIRHKILYVATPKVACTTLKWWFASLEGVTERLHDFTDSSETDPELIIHDSFHKIAPEVTGLTPSYIFETLASADYLTFALVRNPYKRIFSAWQSKILLREPLQIKPYVDTDFFSQPLETPTDIAKAFEFFLEYLLENEAPSFIDHHWTPQVDLLRPDLFRYSFLEKIENSQNLIEKLREWLGFYIPSPFQSRRSNESLIPFAPEFITQRCAELIRILHARDFQVLGYEENIPPQDTDFSAEECNMAIKAIKIVRARHQRLGERNEQIIGLKHELSERDGQLSELQHTATERQQAIFGLKRTLAEQQDQMDNLNQVLAERVVQITGLSGALAERDTQIFCLKQTLAELDIQVNLQEEKLQRLLWSRSWRLTRPLRIIFSQARTFIRYIQIASNRSFVRIPVIREFKIRRIRNSEIFDQTFYSSQNPDVSAAGIDPATHYFLSGWREHRNPSTKFSSRHYLETHPDVAAAGTNPLLHYIEHGKAEGRKIHGVPYDPWPHREVDGSVIAGGDITVNPRQAQEYDEAIDNLGALPSSAPVAGPEHSRGISTRRRLIEMPALLRAVPRVVAFYQGSPSLALHRTFRIWRREGMAGIRRRVTILLGQRKPGTSPLPRVIDLYGNLPTPKSEFTPKVSIIVPNYNHAPYLRQRLDSIYQQTYKNVEVILLDDYSNDASVEILTDFARRFPERTISRFNESNSGSVFRQWKNGLDMATGDLVWIAESDDFCSSNFLAEQVRAFQNPAVTLSFCHTDFVKGDLCERVWTLGDYLSDLDIADWHSPFIRSAQELVCAGWAIKNIVPNVSSALFRHPGSNPLLEDLQWLGLRMCGDWVFYLSIIRGGLVAYTPNATNYYRQHDSSTSQTSQKKDLYYAEHEVVASYLVEFFNVKRNILDKQDIALYRHWTYHRGNLLRSEFRRLYDPNRAWSRSHNRRPNLVMAVYALISGGGETFPIVLANLMYERGFAVTLLNCLERPTEPGVLKMLDPRIPRLELDNLELVGAAFADMGIEVVHSHHAWVDLTLAGLLINNSDIKQIITMHGMYEMMGSNQIDTLMPLLSLRINHFVYTAEKNLGAFPISFRSSKKFTKIANALPSISFNPIDRAALDIGPHDFVLCMVARGIPEKGWDEAIQSVILANRHSARRIHLLLIGDGPEFDRLSEQNQPDFIQLLGFRQNIRDYFSTSDIGFLPSRFKGESAPLVVIDCLLAGKPVLSSDIGEIREMLDSAHGLAGELFQLCDWTLNIEIIAQAIVELANQPLRYQTLCSRVASAARKFSTASMVDSYEEVYKSSEAPIVAPRGLNDMHTARV